MGGPSEKATGEAERLHIYDRWMRISEILRPDTVTSVEELAERLKVSPATIRRDLNELDSHGSLRRVRGGAISAESGGLRFSLPSHLTGQAGYDLSASENAHLKKAIGRRAAQLIEPGEAIIIDGGSTTAQLAHSINTDALAVLTTSVPILFALLQRPGVSIFITGGEVFREQNIVLNPYSDGISANFYASKIFLGAQSINRAGLMQTDPLLVRNEQSLIAQAEKVIVLADSSKFSARGSLSVCALADISMVITDSNIPASAVRMLEGEGVKTEIVDV